MSTTLENTNYINIFDAKLKSYNNIFFKTLQDDGLLKETTDIKNDANALNIASGNTYSTAQFNNFIRNIINFKIKNYNDLGTSGTNLEFVNRAVLGTTTTYSFNNEVKDNIVDTLKILNVFVDILEAYKHCIDKDISTINTGYFDEIVIDRIEVVSSGTRFYVSGDSAAIPAITEKNVGYIRNTKTSGSVGAKNVLYLSIQSFYTRLTTANYNDIFDKNNISGDYNASTSTHNNITTQIFNASDIANANPPVQDLELAVKTYARHYYDSSKSSISTSDLSRTQRNKNVVSLLLKCLFNIDPKFRKQSVYALYYYYKFVQLYATLIINVSNVMYANVSDASANPKRIDTYNTGTASSVTAVEAITEGKGYHNNIDTPLSNPVSVTISGGGGSGFSGTIPYNATTGRIPIGTPVTIANNGVDFTSLPTINTATPKYKADQSTAGKTGSIAKLTASAQTELDNANGELTTATAKLTSYPAAGASAGTSPNTYTGLTNAERLLAQTSINNANFLLSGAIITDTLAIKTAAKIAVYPNLASGATTAQTDTNNSNRANALYYIDILVEKKLAELKINKAQNTLNDLINSSTALLSEPADTPATFIATIVPLAYENTTKTQAVNIDRLKEVIDDIETKITALTTSIRDAADPATEESFVILNSSNLAKINKSSTNNVLIMIPKTNTTIYNKLIKYKEINDIVENCSIYDTKNKKYYDILNISTISLSSVDYFVIELKAVFIKDAAKEYYDIFYKYDGSTYGSVLTDSEQLTAASGDFLEIKRKDINALKNKYVVNKKAIDTLNTNISLNTNRVNNQKNLYETQYNKNVFLSRQILTYNILICTIVVVLIGINVINMDKPLVKSISLACLGIIILLFIIYFMSNITYIETFAMSTSNVDILKDTATALPTRNTKKVSALKTEIDKLNQQFIRYFETIMIKLPTADSNDFYREITSVINADIENKTYLDKILDFNKSQGNTNMDTLKYELENNKLYILTLLISAIIFIGLYNIYINYIDNDKYLSLIIFIAIIIFIVIGAYYIINSNRRVRTIHKNIYWGPQSSESF